jgi:titin
LSLQIVSREGIESDTLNEAALQQIHMLEDHAARTSQYSRGPEEVQVQQVPAFTKPLHNVDIIEGTNVHLECRLQPVNDPSMRVEWYVNGRPIRTGHRFRPAHDFDYVALDLLSVYPEDSGVYSCQAFNMMGEAVTSCSVKVIGKWFHFKTDLFSIKIGI